MFPRLLRTPDIFTSIEAVVNADVIDATAATAGDADVDADIDGVGSVAAGAAGDG